MPRLEYFLVSEGSTIDSETGALSVFNVVNEAKFREPPGGSAEALSRDLLAPHAGRNPRRR